MVVGHVAIGFDNGYVLIYKERMASYSAESLRDKNSYSFHCILGPTDSTRKGDPVKAIDLANDEDHIAVCYSGNDFKNRELVPYVYEFKIPESANTYEVVAECNIIQVHHKDDDFGPVPDYVKTADREVYRGQVTSVSYSQDSSLLAFGYDDKFTQGSVNVWSREAQEQKNRSPKNSPIEPCKRISSVLCDAICFLKHTSEDNAADYDYTLAAGGIDGVVRAYTVDLDEVFPNVDWEGVVRKVPKHVAQMLSGNDASFGAALHSKQRKTEKTDARQNQWVKQKLAERDRLLWQLRVHSRKVTSLSLSKDGDRLVVTSGNAARGQPPIKIVEISKARSAKPNVPYIPVSIADHRPDEIRERGDFDPLFIKSAKIDPDEGFCLVTLCADNRIRLFDARTGALTAESKLNLGLRPEPGKQTRPVADSCFVADGYGIACGGADGYMYIYNNGLPESYRSVENEGPLSFASVSGCGTVVATSDRDDIKFFDAQSGTFLDCRTLGRIVNAISFSPSSTNKYVAAAMSGKNCLGQSFEDGRVAIYQYNFKRTDDCYDETAFNIEPQIAPLDLNGDCENLEFDPTGLRIAVSGSKGPCGAIHMVSTQSGTTLWGSERDGVRVGKVCFSPGDGGQLLISTWYDGEIRLVSASDGTFLTKFRCFERIHEEPLGGFLDLSCLAWSGLTAVDRITDKKCKANNQERHHLAVSLEVRESGIASSENIIRMFVLDNEALRKYRRIVDVAQDTSDAVYPAAVEFEKRTVGWGSAKEKNVSRARIYQTLYGFSDKITGLDFSEDGEIIASSCRDGLMRLHSVITGQLIYESEHHNNRCLSVQFMPNGRVLTSSTSGYYHIFPYQQYFNSLVVLMATLSLQPCAARLLKAVLQRCGRLATYFKTEFHGNLNDLLMYNADTDAFCRYDGMYPFKSRKPDTPPPRLAINMSVMPKMLKMSSSSTVPAFRRMMHIWPHATPSQLFLERRYATKESIGQQYGGKNPRVSILDAIMCRPKSAETISALIHIIEHLNYCGFELIDRNSLQTAFWAVTRAIPDMFHSYPDLAVLSLRLELHNTSGCDHIQFRQDNEQNLEGTLVSTTDSPRWSDTNVKQWRPFLVPEHRDAAPDKVDIDFTKFGVVPKVSPLPGADLLWDSIVATARRDPVVGEMAFDSQIVAAIIESKWREINQIFKLHLFLYAGYVGLMTYLCLHYAREDKDVEAVGLQYLYAGDGAEAGVHSMLLWITTALNIWFLLHELIKLKQLGHPEYRPLFFAIDWLAHVLFFVGIVLYAEVPRRDIQKVVFSAAMLCTWIKLLFFCRVSESWSKVTVMMHVFITKIYAFLIVMVMVMVGFSFMFMVIHPESYSYFSNVPESFISMLALTFGDFDSIERRGPDADDADPDSIVHSAWLYYMQSILALMYMFIVAVFLLNVLIAILSQEYALVSRSPRWRIDTAMLIRELMCFYRFLEDEELYDISWFEIDQKCRSGNKVKWLHIIPPDDNPFWYTNLNPESGDDALYRRIEDVQVELKEMHAAQSKQVDLLGGGGGDGMAAVDTRQSVALLTDKVNNILHRVGNIEGKVDTDAVAPSRASFA